MSLDLGGFYGENFVATGDFDLDYGEVLSDGRPYKPLRTIADFETFLTERRPSEEPYGGFTSHDFMADVTMCHFFGSEKAESLLADIEQKNAEQGMGNVQIPNTNIRLINYSVCPLCGRIFSFKELADYYRHPETDSRFSSPGDQARNDTRVRCSDCKTWFLPALVIADGTPKNEIQFLCRNQTMDAVEKFFDEKGKKVLTKVRSNILTDTAKGFKAVKNDVTLGEMEEKPTLIANMLQYTPANLALNMIDGSNVEKGDVLYGWWGKGF